ncbi:hypothetical protein HG263_00295 [Pseudoalteromonas sp. JBTF-M23]|uniref:Uncharacterized protein n=1 Tax=Pseudoalteromonas caenipelagi TaxID=2726988 RepID=A0A849V7S5_9GAMM|nr:hypothetical protein [Pseudoalteromonas caenipelagi]NOU48988.1 hypothetical protein [Pseudoalteromonas caenipelagi]
MKRKIKLFTSIICIALSNASFAGNGWKGPGAISSVQPEMYRQGDSEGGYPILIETNIPSPDCGGTVWAIRSNWDDGNRMYSAALTALASGKDVQLYQSSCYTVGGKPYPRIGGIKVSN